MCLDVKCDSQFGETSWFIFRMHWVTVHCSEAEIPVREILLKYLVSSLDKCMIDLDTHRARVHAWYGMFGLCIRIRMYHIISSLRYGWFLIYVSGTKRLSFG